MISIIDISLIIIAVSVAAIAIYLIPTLKQMKLTAKAAEDTIHELKTHLVPILKKTDDALEDIQDVIKTIKIQTEKVEYTIDNYRLIADRVHQLTEIIYEQVESPIFGAINNLNAFKTGLQTFFFKLISR